MPSIPFFPEIDFHKGQYPISVQGIIKMSHYYRNTVSTQQRIMTHYAIAPIQRTSETNSVNNMPEQRTMPVRIASAMKM